MLKTPTNCVGVQATQVIRWTVGERLVSIRFCQILSRRFSTVPFKFALCYFSCNTWSYKTRQ